MRVAPSKLSCLLLPGPFAAQLEVKGAQLEGGEAEKSQRLFVLKPSSIFCRHQPSSSNAIGGKTELFGECWTPHHENSRGGGWF